MLGVDRLDYTKGIEQRVKAVAELFAEGTLTTPRHVMVQIAVPSREEDTHYQHEREHLEQLVGEVNGAYSQVGHPAIHYLHQSVDLDELVALYLAADLMLVTPFRDGMNLVAKEYVACRVDGTGALVLSEFAGAARELRRRHPREPARPRRDQGRDPTRARPRPGRSHRADAPTAPRRAPARRLRLGARLPRGPSAVTTDTLRRWVVPSRWWPCRSSPQSRPSGTIRATVRPRIPIVVAGRGHVTPSVDHRPNHRGGRAASALRRRPHRVGPSHPRRCSSTPASSAWDGAWYSDIASHGYAALPR